MINKIQKRYDVYNKSDPKYYCSFNINYQSSVN